MLACIVIQKQTISYNYNKSDYDKMRVEAGSINWNEIVTGNDVETDWSRLKLFFEEMKEKFIPVKISQIKQNKWVTRTVIKCRRAKNKAWIKFKASGNEPVAYEKYKEMQKKSQNSIRFAKRSFEQKLAKDVKNYNKSFFSYVSSVFILEDIHNI